MKNSIKVERAKKNITQADLAILAKVSRQTEGLTDQGLTLSLSASSMSGPNSRYIWSSRR